MLESVETEQPRCCIASNRCLRAEIDQACGEQLHPGDRMAAEPVGPLTRSLDLGAFECAGELVAAERAGNPICHREYAMVGRAELGDLVILVVMIHRAIVANGCHIRSGHVDLAQRRDCMTRTEWSSA